MKKRRRKQQAKNKLPNQRGYDWPMPGIFSRSRRLMQIKNACYPPGCWSGKRTRMPRLTEAGLSVKEGTEAIGVSAWYIRDEMAQGENRLLLPRAVAR